MITLIIPFTQIFTRMLAVAMITCIFLAIMLYVKGNKEGMALVICLMFALDFLSVGASCIYMNQSVNGMRVRGGQCFNESGSTYDERYVICEYPKTNPFEDIQPIHPIRWTINGIWFAGSLVNGAIHVKVT